MTMLSFRVDGRDAARLEAAAREMGVDRSEYLRIALRRQLARQAAEHEVGIYERQQLTDDEVGVREIDEWGPAEDWSAWK